MPHLTEFTAKVQFTTSSRQPALIHRATKARGLPSNSAWLQRVVCEALSRDLGIPLEELLAELPPLHGRARFGDDENRQRIPPPAKK